MTSRYIIGIDLGTTNCAVVYFDTHKQEASPKLLRIPQLGKHETLDALEMLPSCLYLVEQERPLPKLPWQEHPSQLACGMWAKTQGAKVPTRLIVSAKSWLSHAAADRKEKILPFEAVHSHLKLSPVEATAHYLAHIRSVWNKNTPEHSLEDQEVIITVPASFDEAARTLTVEAAKRAGYHHLTLLEEPQAAFYSYLMEKGMDALQPNETILVCDIGGGTTDFSLIRVEKKDDKITLNRLAVGQHLLLGGDNMDAALCHYLEQQHFSDLDRTQHLALQHQARLAKEELFTHLSLKNYSIFFAGKGSQVVGGAQSFELASEKVQEILLEGFFGLHPLAEALQLKKASGIRSMGLPYEAEPSITKHLAHFLHTGANAQKPTYLLFNGGSTKPSIFQNRILDSLDLWFGKEIPTQILPSKSLDLAVAYGAAYFGKVRRGEGIRIGGGLPRTFYLEVDVNGTSQALTLLPRGTEEGTHGISTHIFSLTPNQPVSFQLAHSHTRLEDSIGSLVPLDEEHLARLPPIKTICSFGKQHQKEPIEVRLETHLTEVGTLELFLCSQKTEHKWKLEFQIRGEGSEDRSFDKRLVDETVDLAKLEPAQKKLQEAFSVGAQAQLKMLTANLETLLEKEKSQWAPSILRALFSTLIEQADKRHLSSQYAARFWNLAGFFMRPGVGYPLDDHRMKQLWKLILADFKQPKGDEVLLQQWICFRRIAAGLNKGQQGQIFNELFPLVYNKKRQVLNIKGNTNTYIYSEQLRALAAMELVDVAHKIKLGAALVKRLMTGNAIPSEYWALGRVGARQLFCGTMANVIPSKLCSEWIYTLLDTPEAHNKHLPFTLMLLARQTGVREIDLPEKLLAKVTPYLDKEPDLQALLNHERELSLNERDQFFGDSLPIGLALTSLSEG